MTTKSLLMRVSSKQWKTTTTPLKKVCFDTVYDSHGTNMLMSQGVQLCATIQRFEQLEQLNNGRRIDGLILIIAFTPEGLQISVDLPKDFPGKRSWLQCIPCK